MSTQPFLFGSDWIEVKDGNDTARAIFDRHYSRYAYADGRKPKLFVGPGEKMVLISPDAKALFSWRRFICGGGHHGVNCAIYRNEGSFLGKSSAMIESACRLAWQRWPGERLYTFVNPRKVQKSRTPGRCFLKAGWRYVKGKDGKRAVTKARKLLILERLP